MLTGWTCFDKIFISGLFPSLGKYILYLNKEVV
jgi:hypothetical protein